jgi:hypothetical protein
MVFHHGCNRPIDGVNNISFSLGVFSMMYKVNILIQPILALNQFCHRPFLNDIFAVNLGNWKTETK